MDLLDISFGATGISSSAPTATGTGLDSAWGGLDSSSALGATSMGGGILGMPPPVADPWSTTRSTASPALADPWVPSLNKPTTSASPALRMEPWNSQRTQSPSITSTNSSVENWDTSAGLRPSGVHTNGNTNADPWLAKTNNIGGTTVADPWGGLTKPADPWAPALGSDLTKDFGVSINVVLQPFISRLHRFFLLFLQVRPSPVGAITSPNDLDEFDIITNRTKGSSDSPVVGINNNHGKTFLDASFGVKKKTINRIFCRISANDLLGLGDSPLSQQARKPQAKTPQSFLGENSALVNLDNLIKPAAPATTNSTTFNPFGEVTPQRNLFQQNQPPVSISLLSSEAQRDYLAPIANLQNQLR